MASYLKHSSFRSISIRELVRTSVRRYVDIHAKPPNNAQNGLKTMQLHTEPLRTHLFARSGLFLFQIIDTSREDTERITALEILGNVAYISDVRGVILIAQYLPFILALIDLKRQPSHATTCRVLGTVRFFFHQYD